MDKAEPTITTTTEEDNTAPLAKEDTIWMLMQPKWEDPSWKQKRKNITKTTCASTVTKKDIAAISASQRRNTNKEDKLEPLLGRE